MGVQFIEMPSLVQMGRRSNCIIRPSSPNKYRI